MARGKHTCKILKEIRRRIAEANDIELIISECHYKGDCLGTCPKCEAEVRYLEEQLRARSLAGKAIALAGLSAGMIFLSGCSNAASTTSSAESVDETEYDLNTVGMPDSIAKELSKDDTLKEEVDDTIFVMRTEKVAKPKVPVVSEGEEEEMYFVGGEKPQERIEDKNKPGYYDQVFQVVEKSPEFPGGESALREQLTIRKDLSEYKKDPKQTDGTYTVVVQFVVDTIGRVGETKVLRTDVEDQLVIEGVRKLKETLPPFEPAMRDGHKVRAWYTAPIYFIDEKGKE